MSVEVFDKEAFKLVESIVDNSLKEWVFLRTKKISKEKF